MSLIENLYSISSIKADIKSAIEAKGVDMTGMSFADFPGAVSQIQTGGLTETLSVSSNGTYYPSPGVDGFSEVSVNVFPSLGYDYVFSSNGFYKPEDYGYDGFAKIGVNVPQSVYGYTEKDITEGLITLTSLNNSASFIASYAFMFNNYIQTVNLPNCVYVGMSAFYYASGVVSVSLPVCESLYAGAFSMAFNLNNIYLPECISLAAGALRGNALTSVDLPKVKGLQFSTFQNDMQLVSVSIPVCEWISQSAFRGCTLLPSIVLPMVSYIEAYAFSGCTNLSQITLGYSSVCSLFGTNVFTGTPISSGTGSIYVPSSLVSDYKAAYAWNAFESQIFPIPE